MVLPCSAHQSVVINPWKYPVHHYCCALQLMYTAKMPHCSFHASYTPIKVPCCTMLYPPVDQHTYGNPWVFLGNDLQITWCSISVLVYWVCLLFLILVCLKIVPWIILPSGFLTFPWKITMFNGKIHYKWPFSIAMLVYQRVNEWLRHHSPCERPPVPRTERYDSATRCSVPGSDLGM